MLRLIISDNKFLLNKVREFAQGFEYAASDDKMGITVVDVNELAPKYDLILSLHCKQIFPKSLVESVRCINVHPGLNPYNRGWFPHVFSIINELPAGVTIHEMDEKIDNGPIIYQKKVPFYASDTSDTLYKRVLNTEVELLRENLSNIITGNYKTYRVDKGNLNTKDDFKNLCHLDLDDYGSFRKHISILRALSHGDFNNAYFIEKGRKIFIRCITHTT